MTKNTEDFSQVTETVACREYTLPRDENSSEVGFEGTPKLGPYWKSQPTRKIWSGNLHFESVNKDHSHSWVRISHGLNKLVTDLNDNEQDTSEMQFEDNALTLNTLAFASRSKAKAKPQRRISASSST